LLECQPLGGGWQPDRAVQLMGHGRDFEMIRRIGRADGSVVLVAIGLRPDESGDCSVRTCYVLEAAKVEERRQQGRLRLVTHKQIKGPA
jgi:hypothetical protein